MKNLTIKIFAADKMVFQDRIRTVRVSRNKPAKSLSANAYLKVLGSTAARTAVLQSIKRTKGWAAYRQQTPSSAAENTAYDRFEIVV